MFLERIIWLKPQANNTIKKNALNKASNKQIETYLQLVTHNIVISLTEVSGREDRHTSQTMVLLKTKHELRMAATKSG